MRLADGVPGVAQRFGIPIDRLLEAVGVPAPAKLEIPIDSFIAAVEPAPHPMLIHRLCVEYPDGLDAIRKLSKLADQAAREDYRTRLAGQVLMALAWNHLARDIQSFAERQFNAGDDRPSAIALRVGAIAERALRTIRARSKARPGVPRVPVDPEGLSPECTITHIHGWLPPYPEGHEDQWSDALILAVADEGLSSVAEGFRAFERNGPLSLLYHPGQVRVPGCATWVSPVVEALAARKGPTLSMSRGFSRMPKGFAGVVEYASGGVALAPVKTEGGYAGVPDGVVRLASRSRYKLGSASDWYRKTQLDIGVTVEPDSPDEYVEKLAQAGGMSAGLFDLLIFYSATRQAYDGQPASDTVDRWAEHLFPGSKRSRADLRKRVRDAFIDADNFLLFDFERKNSFRVYNVEVPGVPGPGGLDGSEIGSLGWNQISLFRFWDKNEGLPGQLRGDVLFNLAGSQRLRSNDAMARRILAAIAGDHNRAKWNTTKRERQVYKDEHVRPTTVGELARRINAVAPDGSRRAHQRALESVRQALKRLEAARAARVERKGHKLRLLPPSAKDYQEVSDSFHEARKKGR